MPTPSGAPEDDPEQPPRKGDTLPPPSHSSPPPDSDPFPTIEAMPAPPLPFVSTDGEVPRRTPVSTPPRPTSASKDALPGSKSALRGGRVRNAFFGTPSSPPPSPRPVRYQPSEPPPSLDPPASDPLPSDPHAAADLMGPESSPEVSYDDPPFDLASLLDDDELQDEITVVGEMSEPIKALRRGYRQQEPPPEVRRDDSPDIQIVGEDEYDPLLVEELLDDEPLDTAPKLRITAAGATDRGRRRPVNEDAVLLLREHQTFVVADGMGGHAAGEVASGLALEVIERGFFTDDIAGEPHMLWPALADELGRAVEMANAAIHAAQRADERLEGMATTVTALRFSLQRQRAYVAHVGDSRCYRLSAGRLTQLTLDHTIANLIGVPGPLGQQLSRGVGVETSVEVDVVVDVALPDDTYLVCSDGLTKMLPDQDIAAIIMRGGELRAVVQALIDEANRRGGKDNIAVILVRVEEP